MRLMWRPVTDFPAWLWRIMLHLSLRSCLFSFLTVVARRETACLHCGRLYVLLLLNREIYNLSASLFAEHVLNFLGGTLCELGCDLEF